MARYVLNSQEYDGHHEVHNADAHCESETYPRPEHQIDLGLHNNCSEAIEEAQGQYLLWDIDGCAWCTNCHTK